MTNEHHVPQILEFEHVRNVVKESLERNFRVTQMATFAEAGESRRVDLVAPFGATPERCVASTSRRGRRRGPGHT